MTTYSFSDGTRAWFERRQHAEGVWVIIAHLAKAGESWSEWSAEPADVPDSAKEAEEALTVFGWEPVTPEDTWAYPAA